MAFYGKTTMPGHKKSRITRLEAMQVLPQQTSRGRRPDAPEHLLFRLSAVPTIDWRLTDTKIVWSHLWQLADVCNARVALMPILARRDNWLRCLH
jgi:hypothetical protein